jgi:hypothetical protein
VAGIGADCAQQTLMVARHEVLGLYKYAVRWGLDAINPWAVLGAWPSLYPWQHAYLNSIKLLR